MKLSKLVSEIEAIIAEHGDLDVLDTEGFNISELKVRSATQDELKFWGMDHMIHFTFAEIQIDD